MKRTGDVIAELGVSRRTIERWQARGLLKPTRTTPGGQALYSASDVRFAGLAHGLMRAGLRKRRMQKALEIVAPMVEAWIATEVASSHKP